MGKKGKIFLDKKYRNITSKFTSSINSSVHFRNDALFELKNKLHNYSNVYRDDIITSINHMTCNRLFLSKPRLMEGIVYYFLFKYYKSEIAKKKYLVK